MSEVESVSSADASVNQPKSYDVLFVGLVCFVTEKDGVRPVLLPDGTAPTNEDIEPHFPYVIVDPQFILDRSGWETDDPDIAAFMEDGIFRLPKGVLQLNGIDGSGLETSQHDQFVPSLRAADDTARLARHPNAIVELTLQSGKLQAFRRPGQSAAERESHDVAVVSLLTVDHGDEITVSVRSEEGNRLLRLKPGTDVAIANIALPVDETKTASHFPIYAQLVESRRLQDNARGIAPDAPELPGTRYVFSPELGLPINDGTAKCGNQGCCPKP
ncbi:MAG: hypothetical protein JO197_06545 [Acidobacteria bacterium]|nr:hypothetical protein [Acidobacteriota bacterium]MBV9477513.1 hypothetical protein [Acidobacteriota bacterium]